MMMIIIFNIAALSYCRPMGEGNIGLWTLLGPNPNDIILGIHPLRNFFSRPSPLPSTPAVRAPGLREEEESEEKEQGEKEESASNNSDS